MAFRSAWQYPPGRRPRARGRGRSTLVYFSTTAFPVAALRTVLEAPVGGPVRRRRPGPVAERPLPRRPEGAAASEVLACVPARRHARTVRHAPGGRHRVGVRGLLPHARVPLPEPHARGVAPSSRSGAPRATSDALDTLDLPARFFEAGDGHLHVVYVGRGGHDMARGRARPVRGARRRARRAARPLGPRPPLVYRDGLRPGGEGEEDRSSRSPASSAWATA